MKRKKSGCLKYVLIFICVIVVIGIIGSVFSKKKTEEPTEEDGKGVTGIEVEKENIGIDDFSYEVSGDSVILDSYDGKEEILEIAPSYSIDGKEYHTDLSGFQVGHGVKTLILDEGIAEVMTAIFNSSDVEKIFFPKSMINVYDYTFFNFPFFARLINFKFCAAVPS